MCLWSLSFKIERVRCMNAMRQSWKNLHPLPDQHDQLSIDKVFTDLEVEQLRRGFIPEQMEDKWFIFFENNTVFFHRSWTGFCIFEVHLVQEGPNYVISSVLVNRDKSQYYGSTDVYDVKLLSYLVDTLLLEKRSPLPIPENVPAGIEQDLHLAHTAGAGQRHPEGRSINITIRGAMRWFWDWLLWLIRR